MGTLLRSCCDRVYGGVLVAAGAKSQLRRLTVLWYGRVFPGSARSLALSLAPKTLAEISLACALTCPYRNAMLHSLKEKNSKENITVAMARLRWLWQLPLEGKALAADPDHWLSRGDRGSVIKTRSTLAP